MKKKNKYNCLGLMSGSSLDGLDIAHCNIQLAFDNSVATVSEWKINTAATIPFSSSWQNKLLALPESNGKDLVQTHYDFGHYLGELVSRFLDQYEVEPDFIASHGHTIFHYPDQHFTLQLGDGAALAAKTGLPVINDLRSMDMALGGQGAPIAPIADRMLFSEYDLFLNLGGIANICYATRGRYFAFDIGGANQILNALVAPIGIPYDEDGAIAARGKPDRALIESIDRLPYFRKTYPKSLGNDWVREKLLPYYLSSDISLEDKLYSACYQLARQVAKDIGMMLRKEGSEKSPLKMLVTGGGAFNSFLVKLIGEECQKVSPVEVTIPDPKVVSFKEAAMVALMGALRVSNTPNCIHSVTGASRNAIGGAIHQGWKKQI